MREEQVTGMNEGGGGGGCDDVILHQDGVIYMGVVPFSGVEGADDCEPADDEDCEVSPLA